MGDQEDDEEDDGAAAAEAVVDVRPVFVDSEEAGFAVKLLLLLEK